MKTLKKNILLFAIPVIALMSSCGNVAVHVERNTKISAPKDVIMNQLADFKEFNQWSPWTDYDPNCKYNYEGEMGKVGSKYSWEGNDDVGVGSMEITEITDTRITNKLIFTSPWESVSTAYYELKESENGINVVWGYDGESPRIMSWFMDMDDMLGPDYEKGLKKLKEICESAKEEKISTYDIAEVDFGTRVYAVKRSEVQMGEIAAYFGEHFPAIFQKIGESGATPMGVAGIFWEWNEETGVADMAAAVQAEGTMSELEGYEVVEASGKALQIAYYGNYTEVGPAHEALGAYMESNGLEFNEMVIEEYVTDPTSEPDTSKWLTNIYYLVK